MEKLNKIIQICRRSITYSVHEDRLYIGSYRLVFHYSLQYSVIQFYDRYFEKWR